jgi:hypothetical protein
MSSKTSRASGVCDDHLARRRGWMGRAFRDFLLKQNALALAVAASQSYTDPDAKPTLQRPALDLRRTSIAAVAA